MSNSPLNTKKKAKKAEFSVYLNRKTNAWLFSNADSFNGTARRT
ncbi:MAG: hypothetical protein R2822_05000 [Spirosomataceae bacterium]